MTWDREIKVLVDGEERGWVPAVLVEQDMGTTKTVDGVDLKRSDFAVRGDADEVGTWKLPLTTSPGGSPDHGRVSAAITALQPGGFRGQPVQLQGGERAQAIRNISGAIGRSDFSDDQKETLRERLGKLEKMLVVMEEGTEPPSDPADEVQAELTAGFRVYEEAGEARWIALTSNAFRDLTDNIISGASLEAYAEATMGDEVPEPFRSELEDRGLPVAPLGELWFAHIPHFRIGEVLTTGYHDGFLLEVGRFDENPVAQEIARNLRANEGDWRVSHGFLRYQKDGVDDGVFNMPIWKFETSPLPAGMEANPWTAVGIFDKEDKAMTEQQRQALIAALGGDEERADGILANISKWSTELKDGGIEFRAIFDIKADDEPDGDNSDPDPGEPPSDDQDVKPEQMAAPLVLAREGEAMQLIVQAVREDLEYQALAESVRAMVAEVEALKASQNQPHVVLERRTFNRPSQDPETVVPDAVAKDLTPVESGKHPLDTKMKR